MLCQNSVHNLPERRHTVALRYLQIYLWLNTGVWPESNGLAFRNVLVSSGVDAWYSDTGYRYGDTGDLVSGWGEYWSETRQGIHIVCTHAQMERQAEKWMNLCLTVPDSRDLRQFLGPSDRFRGISLPVGLGGGSRLPLSCKSIADMPPLGRHQPEVSFRNG